MEPIDVDDAIVRGGKRNVLLVLDLNGLLLDRPKRKGPHAWRRPHLDEFVAFVLDAFHVGVWSSMMRKNVDPLTERAFGARRRELLFEMNQDDCVEVAYPPPVKKPLLKKPLEHVWDRFDKFRGATLLIDDTALKAMDNPPHTLFCPPAWTHDCLDDDVNNALGPGGAIRTYLEELLLALDRGRTLCDFVAERDNNNERSD